MCNRSMNEKEWKEIMKLHGPDKQIALIEYLYERLLKLSKNIDLSEIFEIIEHWRNL